ncbi:DUF7839 domain-containing protein [Picrophilus oshimae]|uniref:Transcriptional regulator n=1 Tax=Picrophilus torridus (strain ATCC 700027 / DSM 9790 / JCM 10055 / NBRC 100828 / KAW 2/3) TaxID=1122961 RepID=A0A8G2FX31_PICTO|nr:ArsR family transcriptional regulator [Picrophilus oshimae]SMD31059.1 transcriptional regulator [Picrophilus oshimae DSM 9789]
MKLEQAFITQIMILMSIRNGKRRPSEIARDVNITLQGVIYHLKILRSNGYIDDDNNITLTGFNYLYNGLSDMENFFKSNLMEMDSIMTWEAIAACDLNKDERVYLYMDNGYLYAKKDKMDGATGIAAISTKKGGCTGVTSINGIIKLNVGSVDIAQISNVEENVNYKILTDRLKNIIESKKYHFKGVLGEYAFTVLKQSNIRPDFEYAPIESGYDAARRGFSTIIVTSKRMMHFYMDRIKEMQKQYPEININMFTID